MSQAKLRIATGALVVVGVLCAGSALGQANILSAVWTGPPDSSCIPITGDFRDGGGPELTEVCGDAWHMYARSGAYLGGVFIGQGLGGATQVPAPEDYTGNGQLDPTVFREGAWLIFNSVTGAIDEGIFTGPALAGCQAIPGNYTGDSQLELATFCPDGNLRFSQRDGTFIKEFQPLDSGGSPIAFGTATAFAADWNGDGFDQPTLWINGAWFIQDYAANGFDQAFFTGPAEGEPTPFDYDGDGADEPGAYCYNGGTTPCTGGALSGAWLLFQYDYGTNAATFDRGVWVGSVGGGVEERPISRRTQD